MDPAFAATLIASGALALLVFLVAAFRSDYSGERVPIAPPTQGDQ